MDRLGPAFQEFDISIYQYFINGFRTIGLDSRQMGLKLHQNAVLFSRNPDQELVDRIDKLHDDCTLQVIERIVVEIKNYRNRHGRASAFKTDNSRHPLLFDKHFLQIVIDDLFRAFGPAVDFHATLGTVHTHAGGLCRQTESAGQEDGA